MAKNTSENAFPFSEIINLIFDTTKKTIAVSVEDQTVADGSNATTGAKADAAITDAAQTGSLMSFTKGIVKVLADVWDSTNHLLGVYAADVTDKLMNGSTALTPKFAVISASSSGNNNIVAAVTSKKIRVLAYNFIANGTVNAKFQSDGAGSPVDKTGLKYCVVNSGICAPYNPKGWFETAAGKTLDINLSGAVAIGGELVYVEV